MIVAYATKGPYEATARDLKKSLEKLKLKHQIDILPSKSSWRENTHIRAKYLLGKFDDGHEWLLSLDSDCVVLSDPLPYMKKLKCDIAVHYIKKKKKKGKKSKKELLPGTLWLRNTRATRKMLYLWDDFAVKKPDKPDRFCCRNAVDLAVTKYDLIIAKLPPEYTYIFDTSKKIYPGVEPIIMHLQASRKLKKLIRAKK